jgi:hypothetical protein
MREMGNDQAGNPKYELTGLAVDSRRLSAAIPQQCG